MTLTEDLVQGLTEDRTKDFTLALMDFTQWDESERQRKLEEIEIEIEEENENIKGKKNKDGKEGKEAKVGDGRGLNDEASHASESALMDVSPIDKYYVWPDFILDMLNRPTEWGSWRKKVERGLHFEAPKIVRVKKVDKSALSDEKNIKNEKSEKNEKKVIKSIKKKFTAKRAYNRLQLNDPLLDLDDEESF